VKRRAVILAGAAALLGALGAVVAVNRDKTRLRLDYPPGEVVVTRDVVYVPGSGNPKHRLDVYAPKGAAGAPVVHFVHGGYWREGDKDFYAAVSGLYGSVGVTLAKRGVVTVVQSYRLSPEAAIDAIVDDVMAGLRWTEQHAGEHGGDPGHIFMMGHSAGGHLVALAGSDEALHRAHGMDPRAVRGYIPLSAVWDVAGMADVHDAAWNAQTTFPVFGTDRARWAERSPASRLHQGVQPFFVVVGERDVPFMIPQAERARDRLKELGAEVEYLRVPGSDHAGVVLRFGAGYDNISGPVADFVRRR
jgi:acetyl esterase/lipase